MRDMHDTAVIPLVKDAVVELCLVNGQWRESPSFAQLAPERQRMAPHTRKSFWVWSTQQIESKQPISFNLQHGSP